MGEDQKDLIAHKLHAMDESTSRRTAVSHQLDYEHYCWWRFSNVMMSMTEHVKNVGMQWAIPKRNAWQGGRSSNGTSTYGVDNCSRRFNCLPYLLRLLNSEAFCDSPPRLSIVSRLSYLLLCCSSSDCYFVVVSVLSYLRVCVYHDCRSSSKPKS